MKHGSLLFIMSCIVATAAVAQQKADIKVHYIQDYNGMRELMGSDCKSCGIKIL